MPKIFGIPKDDGCRFAPSCLSCPFPVCHEDDPWHEAFTGLEGRNKLIRKAIRAGKAKVQIAQEFGITTRQVYRIKNDST